MRYEDRVIVREKALEYKGQYISIPPEVAKSLLEELEPKRDKSDREYYNLHRLKESIEGILYTLDALHPEMFDKDKSIKELYAWKPEQFQAGVDFKESGYYTKGDEDAPFFSEAFLYNLLGKSDARSLLGLIKRAVGSKGIL